VVILFYLNFIEIKWNHLNTILFHKIFMRKIWLITVDMGYGHQRAAYSLADLAYERVITANSDKIVSTQEKKQWNKFEVFYNTISKLKSIPLIGEKLWNIYDRLQAITPIYPFRDLSKPNFGALYIEKLIKKGFLKSIIEYTECKNLPLVSTFFATTVAAGYYNQNKVYCIVTDTDINRVWVPTNPKKSKIIYLAPTDNSVKRLAAYGVSKKNIFFTGFPLPKENFGKDHRIVKHDLGNRLINLDPNKIHINRYLPVIKKLLGNHFKLKSKRVLTLTYAVGGAGAQKEIGKEIIISLKKKIKQHKIKLILISGTCIEVYQYFLKIVEDNNLHKEIGKYIILQNTLDKKVYFEEFNDYLRITDILWSKPSEISFYSALGLPIIMAPPIGYHEKLNKKWLMRIGSGIDQEDPKYCNEWLFEWIEKGILAEAAWEGYLEAPKYGTENIEKIIFAKDKSKVKLKY
jgi:hypothetical protein